MPQVQGSECPSDECTRCEEGPVEKKSDGVGAEPPRLPTAKDCANQLSSIFNSETITEASRQNEGANQLCIVQSSKPHAAATTSSGTELQVGRGSNLFELHVIVDHCHDISHFQQSNSGDGSPSKSVWLSYRLFGTVTQSEIFNLTRTDDFTPFLSSFRIRSSPKELAEYFSAKKSGTLRIHLCTEGEVMGTALVDLRPLIAIEDSTSQDFQGRMTQDEYPVIPRNAIGVDGVQALGSPRISRAKLAAAVDQAVAAQKSAAEANKKVKQVEAAMDQLRVDQRATPEVSLMHQLAELKGQLADGERRIEAIKAEKAQVTAEKEQFRSNVHKLARALRHEREKAAKQKGASQVRLSYDADEKSFVLGGGQDEITRILADLNRLSQGAACQPPVAASTPARQPLRNIQQQSGGSGMTHGPPLPSPQSLCPTPIIRTHSPIIGAPAQLDGLNLDG